MVASQNKTPRERERERDIYIYLYIYIYYPYYRAPKSTPNFGKLPMHVPQLSIPLEEHNAQCPSHPQTTSAKVLVFKISTLLT